MKLKYKLLSHLVDIYPRPAYTRLVEIESILRKNFGALFLGKTLAKMNLSEICSNVFCKRPTISFQYVLNNDLILAHLRIDIFGKDIGISDGRSVTHDIRSPVGCSNH